MFLRSLSSSQRIWKLPSDSKLYQVFLCINKVTLKYFAEKSKTTTFDIILSSSLEYNSQSEMKVFENKVFFQESNTWPLIKSHLKLDDCRTLQRVVAWAELDVFPWRTESLMIFDNWAAHPNIQSLIVMTLVYIPKYDKGFIAYGLWRFKQPESRIPHHYDSHHNSFE